MERIAADSFVNAAALPALTPPTSRGKPSPLAFDPEKYRTHVAHLDMSEDDKTELLRAVWDIMQSFVDRAFGDDAAQLATGPVGKRRAKDETGDSAVVSSLPDDLPNDDKDKLSRTFRRMAGKRERRKR